MKIELLIDLPVSPKYDMVKGRVLEVSRLPSRRDRGGCSWYVAGDAGDEVGVKSHEAKVVKDIEPRSD